MTDLERRLTATLERLSAQYGMEQQRHAESRSKSCGGKSSSRPIRAKLRGSKSSGSTGK